MKTFQESSKIVDFIGRAPTGGNFHQNFSRGRDINKANTGVRWVHITTRNETSKKCARPDNKHMKEMNLLKLTLQSPLRVDPSGINRFMLCLQLGSYECQ